MGDVLRALRRKLRFGQLEREKFPEKRVVGNTDTMPATRRPHPHYVIHADEARHRK